MQQHQNEQVSTHLVLLSRSAHSWTPLDSTSVQSSICNKQLCTRCNNIKMSRCPRTSFFCRDLLTRGHHLIQLVCSHPFAINSCSHAATTSKWAGVHAPRSSVEICSLVDTT